jgi:hypothetical protein
MAVDQAIAPGLVPFPADAHPDACSRAIGDLLGVPS